MYSQRLRRLGLRWSGEILTVVNCHALRLHRRVTMDYSIILHHLCARAVQELECLRSRGLDDAVLPGGVGAQEI